MPPLFRSLLAIWLLAPCLAWAETLLVCTDNHSHPPLLTPAGGGIIGQRLAHAARKAGVDIAFAAVPIARCRVDIASGKLHAFPLTPFSNELLPIVRYPERDGQADRSRTIASAHLMVFYRIGSALRWDGARFGGLQRPVLISAGAVAMRERVLATGAPLDEHGRSLAVNFSKLLAGRGDAAIGWEHEGRLLMEDARFAGKVGMQALPLGAGIDYYLAVGHGYYRRNAAQVERLWDAIGRRRAAELAEAAKPLHK